MGFDQSERAPGPIYNIHIIIMIILMSYTLDSNLTINFFQWVVLSTHWTTPASKFLESVIDLTQMQLCATYNFLGAVNSIRVYHEQTLG